MVKTKVTITENNLDIKELPGEDIPVGTFFLGEIESPTTPGRRLFLRHYSGIIDIENSNTNWSGPKCPYVRNYKPFTEITIDVSN